MENIAGKIIISLNGSWIESEVAGFFVFAQIWIKGYFRLGWVRVKECPAGARNRVKASVKIHKNLLLWILLMIQIFV